jgi:hypothetical protein
MKSNIPSLSVVFVLSGVLLSQFVASPSWADAIDRLQPDRLKAVHEAVEALKAERRPVTLDTGFDDVRTLLHVHSHLSHDSRGSLETIVQAARAARVRVILFSEHPADHYDYFSDGHSGLHDGVLLVPGAETGGFLAYPTRSMKGVKAAGSQEFVDLIRRDDGLVFLSHLEERMDWEIDGLTGTEIYNTHADVKDERRFAAAWRDPATLFQLLPAMRQYPQEAFAALQDYPADYLKRWDELCQKHPLTGIAANDSHQNQAVILRLADSGKVQVEDALGKKLRELDAAQFGFLKKLIAEKRPGDVVFEQFLDLYEHSFGYVSTHLLVPQLDREAVWDALKRSRAYVAFDWMADPSGFAFIAASDTQKWPMGAEVPISDGLRLRVATPVAGTIKLLRNGQTIREATGRTLDETIAEPGNYRVEVWLAIAGENRPWILSNPIYVRASRAANSALEASP